MFVYLKLINANDAGLCVNIIVFGKYNKAQAILVPFSDGVAASHYTTGLDDLMARWFSFLFLFPIIFWPGSAHRLSTRYAFRIVSHHIVKIT